MRNRLLLILLCIVSASLLPPRPAGAAYQVLHGTFGSGGGVRAGGGYISRDTAGQPIIGIVAGPSNIAKAGFWYCAGISSTVDVAITTFFAELRDDAVWLSWTASSSAPFEGFNVYRSGAAGEAFAKINDALIPRERGNSYRDETALPGQAYLYRIGAVSEEGEWYSQNISIFIPPKPTTLYQNYPNPFNPSTSIAFYLPQPGHVALVIYDVNGIRVRSLIDGMQPVGRHTVLWDGRNDSGRQVGSGVYYYRLAAGKHVITRKLVVVR
jgi:hypothetical protein